ncbi:MAG: nitroreductase family protein [Dehalococcoidia bacterium]|nr:nitroreductase family protein [Dehalococcoidia bacterium]MCC6266606.1 nitroreductase family protein [Dehalococcoidia bacterium]
MSETYDTIVSKRDTRRFSDRPIPPDTLARLVQAARMAGSAKAAQPVRLVLVSDQAQKERLAACGNFTPHIPTCQVAVVFVLVPEAGVIGAPFAIFRGPFDAGRAAQNLMLAAWAEGIASCPASMHHAEQAAEVLGLPEGHVVANVIALGYPADDPDPVLGTRPRMPATDYVHRNRWGQ